MELESGWKDQRDALHTAVSRGDAAEALHASQKLLAYGRPADVAFCATAFRKLDGPLQSMGHKKLRTFLVRSVTVEPLLPAMQVEAVLNGYVLEIEVGGYGSYMSELLDQGGAIDRFQPDLVCVLLDPEEMAGRLPELCAHGLAAEIDPEIEVSVARVAHLLAGFRAHHPGRLVLQGCVLPEVSSLGAVGDANVPHSLLHAMRELNLRLAAACRNLADCVFFDVEQTASRYGRERWCDQRMFLATRLAVAPGAFRAFAHALLRSASVMFRPARKVLCTDLDNTLWGGILGEDGPAGIQTGAAFPGVCFLRYQRYLKELGMRGILLAITSKNNEADVAEAFAVRAADLGVTWDDFVVRKIGWSEKTEALQRIASELSLGLDSLVFVDDNPVECEAVRQHLPEVAVVEVPVQEPWRLVPMLSQGWYFDAALVTVDDRNRVQEYRAQTMRTELSQTATSRDEFLASLGIVCTFLSAADGPLERSVQLLAKTNQFNLTTRRHSASEVLTFVEDRRCQAIAIRVRDRFGDAGVVGLALSRQQGVECWIDSLLLSCRVIGRGIETALLAYLAAGAADTGCRWLVGEYLETKKNKPCQDFYPQHGFAVDQVLSGVGRSVYRYDMAAQRPESPSWLTLEGTQPHESRHSTAILT